ncbi:MAG: dihydrolipoamide acetyltransferase family protein [Gemmatimonadota bacterium]
MVTEVVMPKLGLTMERGTVAAWLVPEGGQVKRGQPLLEVETDKVTMEVEAQASGILRRILVPAGEEVEVATPIGLIAAADEDLPVLRQPSPPAAAMAPAASPPPSPQTAATTDGSRPPHRTSPKARRMAADHGLDLSAVSGSGPGGRILSRDLEALLQPQIATPAAPRRPRALQVAADRLAASYREAPHVHLSADIGASWLRQLRQGFAAQGHAVSFTDLIVCAAARALTDLPQVNALYREGQVHRLEAVDIGIATDTPAGLVVPVLRGAAHLSVPEVAAESFRLVEGARAGTLGPDDYAGGGFTVTNLGMFGVRSFTAILNPPQVAILAVGAIEDRVVALTGRGGETPALGIKPLFTATLGLDHRALDGATGARFLQRLKHYLESPGLLA